MPLHPSQSIDLLGALAQLPGRDRLVAMRLSTTVAAISPKRPSGTFSGHPLVVRAAAACMEKNLCEKRYRHFLNLWSQTDCQADPEQLAYYQSRIYAEKRRIEELEKDRQATFEDLVTDTLGGRILRLHRWLIPI
jgi:hypothetical protein